MSKNRLSESNRTTKLVSLACLNIFSNYGRLAVNSGEADYLVFLRIGVFGENVAFLKLAQLHTFHASVVLIQDIF